MDFTREEIWQLESRARAEKEKVLNPHWIRAYEELEYALNVLDAHMARSSVNVPETKSASESV